MEYRGRGHAAAPPTKIAGRVVDAAFGGLDRRDVGPYLVAQVVGCVAGAVLANGMFELAAVSIFPPPPRRDRAPPPSAPTSAPPTGSPARRFANPAISVGRMFSDTFAGIAPEGADVSHVLFVCLHNAGRSQISQAL